MEMNHEQENEGIAKEIINRFFLEAKRERKLKYFRTIIFSLITLGYFSYMLLGNTFFPSSSGSSATAWKYDDVTKNNDAVELAASERATIAVLPIQGVIAGDALKNMRAGGLFDSNSANTVAWVRQTLSDIRKKLKKENITTLVLYIDSPGGTVTASDEIYHLLREWKRNTGVRVVAYVHGIAASGGYYIAQAADEIVADETSITGSIGVILSGLNYVELAKRIGVKNEPIKSGKLKDMGSPFRAMTSEEQKILQDLVNDSYEKFLSVIAEGRNEKLTKVEIRNFADGRIFSAKQAKAAKLIDDTAPFDDFLKKETDRIRKEKSQFQGSRVMVYAPRSPSIFDTISSQLSFFPGNLPIDKTMQKPRLLYLWAGGL